MIRKFALPTVLLATAVLPATASAAPRMEFAIQDDAVFVDQRWMARDRALEHARALGTKRIRVNILWARTLVSGAEQRTPPAEGAQYDFSKVDALQAAAAAHGIKLQLTVTGPAPAWATKDGKVGANQPDPVKFAAFVRTVAAHFKGRVDRYSVWNEPNLSAWLAPSRTAPQQYRALYKAAYTAIKTVDPRSKVLFGELAPNRDGRTIAPLKFIRAAAPRNARLKADGLAHHPYQFTVAPTRKTGGPEDAPISQLPRLIRTLDQLAKIKGLSTPKGKGLDLYLTEFGYLSAGNRAISQSARATWLRSAYTVVRSNRRVKQMLQYQLVDGTPDQLWHTAIIDNHGRPMGAYAGLAKAAASLVH
ncbi:cellulase family glycosylhydrolase [Solirubrobacter sp. CPCC 204708]|uniref:Cellulase family glycosylhydrolase n=1 Tax=Solirubrobacter deserti TaxID=2282478 RepID=A0ABT4REE9_9ACTN|nr:cellulase family glycosylhydrolase [Solirubrobacter deserti]MBE2316172.1 cellulase family glycosylhydrolase [Solirubrobacter deserti]MDA0136921.1 cellulase family glycosylhydrolase [Solirubrobacter deserti]